MSGRTFLKRVVPGALQPPAVASRTRRRWERSPVVRAGPFAGMEFTWADWDARYSAPFAKCMGTYELELHATLEEIVAGAPRRIVEVGAADGYYAVGFARRLPQAEIVVFEELESGRALLAEVALANGVAERVMVHGRCEPADLERVLADERAAVLMLDVEGYENVLLNPAEVPGLRRTAILVECHEQFVPGVTETLRGRFAETHAIREIGNRPRTFSDLPALPWWLKRYCRHQLLGWANERVGAPMSWLLLQPKTAVAGIFHTHG